MVQTRFPYTMLPLPLLAMAALLTLSIPQPSALAADTDSFEDTDQTIECTHDLVVVSFSAQPADLASLDNGTDRTVGAKSTTEATEGANAPFPRPQFAGNGIEESGGLYRATERIDVGTTTSPVTFMSAFKLDMSPRTAPNSEYRYLATFEAGNDWLDRDGFRTARSSTVQLL